MLALRSATPDPRAPTQAPDDDRRRSGERSERLVARRRPQSRGNHYEKRRSEQATAPVQGAPASAGLSSADAGRLAERISATQQRYRVVALRLLQARACGVVVVDTRTGREYVLERAAQWTQLLAR